MFKISPRFILPILAYLFFLPTILYSKCPVGSYHIVGTVLEKETGNPLEQVKILIFSEDEKCSILIESSNRNTVTSVKDGTYKAKILFDTYSGRSIFGADKCDRKPRKISLLISKRGFRAHKKQIRETDLIRMKFGSIINLGAIYLQPLSK